MTGSPVAEIIALDRELIDIAYSDPINTVRVAEIGLMAIARQNSPDYDDHLEKLETIWRRADFMLQIIDSGKGFDPTSAVRFYPDDNSWTIMSGYLQQG